MKPNAIATPSPPTEETSSGFQPVHALFDSQVLRTPDATAIEDDERPWTYRELALSAERVAQALRARGVRAEDRVGICLGRGGRTVATLLGTWKAGAAYVPLDPAYPQDRLSFMARDSELACVICEPETAARPVAQGVPTLHWTELAPERERTAPPVPLGRHALAYVLYTSGSTGTPKGVAVEHGGVRALIDWAARVYTPRELSGVLASTSICFDLSVFELFVPLCLGGCVRIVRSLLELDAQQSRAALRLINTVPSVLSAYLNRGPLPPSVTTVNLAGEPLPGALVKRLYACRGIERVINLYGPSEDTTYSTFAVIERDDARAPSIGQPLDGTRVELLDDELRPVPVGEVGQIYLGGCGLARGYWRRPSLSAEFFIPDFLSSQPGARLYRTGDYARWRGDGALEFCGRRDQQLKIRGFRVELAEIENALEQHTEVAQCIVDARRDDQAPARLVAYVTPVQGASPQPAQLRTWLQRKLPEHMIPHAIVLLARFTLTPSGKVDRKALPEPEWGREASTREPAAPSTELEQRLAGFWCEVLGTDQVGVNSHFLEVGGDSLRALRVISRIRTELGITLSLRSFFQEPRIAGLARTIEAQCQLPSTAAHSAPQPVALLDDELDAPLSFAQQRLWFQHRLDSLATAYNTCFVAEVAGPVQIGPLERSLHELVRRHETLRTVFLRRAGEPRQRVLDAAPLPLRVVTNEGVRELGLSARISEFAQRELSQAFDLDSDIPPWRLSWIAFDANRHALVLTAHHIIFDDWSARIFFDELVVGHHAAASGRDHCPAPLQLQYRDYARWQRTPGHSGAMERQLCFWKQQLQGATHTLELADANERRALESGDGVTHTLDLDPAVCALIRALVHELGATMFMVLGAAFAVLLYARTRQPDILIGVAHAGRNHKALEALIGLFVNPLVLRAQLGDQHSFRRLVQLVRTASLDALDHQDLPFERLVEELRLPRSLGRNPLFQVAFGVQDEPLVPLQTGDLALELYEVPNPRARLDLTLWIEQRRDAGLRARWTYAPGRFGASAVDELHTQWVSLLQRVAAEPDSTVATLCESLGAKRPAGAKASQPASAAQPAGLRFRAPTPKAVRTARGAVEHARLLSGSQLPHLVTAQTPGLLLDEWAAHEREAIARWLLETGAVLFRGFSVRTFEDVRRAANALSSSLIEYRERSSPRTQLAPGVYTSTDHPSHQTIALHCEQSYTLSWPLHILFACLEPATEGGATPLASGRAILKRLSPSTVESFEKRQILYVRNYNRGLGLPWQEVFQTTDRSTVEAECRRRDIQYEWQGGDRLRTLQRRPAFRIHPITGERVWFNHVFFFNVASLDPSLQRAMNGAVARFEAPFQSFFGDGGEFSPEILGELRTACEAEKVRFDWVRGDLLLVDNMLTLHGREPYRGPRQIVTVMAHPVEGASV